MSMRLLALIASKIAPIAPGTVLAESMEEFVRELWTEWAADPSAREAELRNIARTDPQELAALVQSLEPAVPTEVERRVQCYLLLVAKEVGWWIGSVTETGGAALTDHDDLLMILPPRLPLFCPGDQPLAGADWELDMLLGLGDFGEVWRARNRRFPGVPPAALKFCLDPAVRRRLLGHEAELLNRVMRAGKHPGIVQLQNTYFSNDPPCLEYEYVNGGDLASFMSRWQRGPAPPSPDEAARIILMLADIVGFTHRLDPPVVHRDLKPSNVLVQWLDQDRLQLKITDFGIGGLGAVSRVGTAAAETVRGLLQPTFMRGAGSPLYSSPQQIAGAAPDPRDDVFALGVIWYQLLTGNWSQGRPGGVRWARQLGERGVPANQVELLTACLEELPADRPADGAALAQRLEQLLYQEPVGFEPLPIPSAPVSMAQPTRKPNPQILCFKANEVTVSSLAISRDGKQVLVAGGGRTFGTSGSRVLDCTVRIFEIDSGKEVRCFTGHRGGAILEASWCLANQRILSGGADSSLCCWDAATGKEMFRFPNSNSIHGIAVSPDGKWGLSGGVLKMIQVWDLAAGRAMREIRGHTDTIRSIVFSPNGGLALSASEDRTIRLWVLAKAQESRRLVGHTNWVHGAQFLPDGRHAVSASADQTVRVWDLATGKQSHVFEIDFACGQCTVSGCIACSPDGQRLLYSASGGVGLLDLATGKQLACFEGHTGTARCVAFTPDGQKGISGGMDGTVRVWQLPP